MIIRHTHTHNEVTKKYQICYFYLNFMLLRTENIPQYNIINLLSNLPPKF